LLGVGGGVLAGEKPDGGGGGGGGGGGTCMNSGRSGGGNEQCQHGQHINCGLLRNDALDSGRWLPVVSDKPTAFRFSNINYRKLPQSFRAPTHFNGRGGIHGVYLGRPHYCIVLTGNKFSIRLGKLKLVH